MRRDRLLSVLGVGVLSTGLAACGGGSASSVNLPYEQSFSGGCAGWSTQDDDQLQPGCQAGGGECPQVA
jgi:hypothetical protein